MSEHIGSIALWAICSAAALAAVIYVFDRRHSSGDRRNSVAHAGFIGGTIFAVVFLTGVDWQFFAGPWQWAEQIVRLLLRLAIGLLVHELLLKILFT